MTTVLNSASRLGGLLRRWRSLRRVSQLDLATQAEVSARHLSFVETGRSRPSRELVLHLAEHLELPLRDRNELLAAAGFAPLYRQSTLDDPTLTSVRAAIDMILANHAPFPAFVIDGGWQLLDANNAAPAAGRDHARSRKPSAPDSSTMGLCPWSPGVR